MTVRKLMVWLATLAIAGAVSLIMTASSAIAQAGSGKGGGKTVVSHITIEKGTIDLTYSNESVSVSNGNAAGKVQLHWQKPNGYHTSAKCVVVKRWLQNHAHKCVIAGKAMKGKKFGNSGLHTNGQRVYFTDYVGSKYTPIGSKFYWDSVHHTWRKANCGNFARFGHLPALPAAKVVLTQYLTATATVTASLTETIPGFATASCKSKYGSASATIQTIGSATATATATATAHSKKQALSAVRVHTRGTVLTQKNSVHASAVAAVKLSLHGKARAYCKSTTPPPVKMAKVILIKKVFVNGKQVSTPAGFVFTDGKTFENKGYSTKVGMFPVGSMQTICETDPKGYTPDQWCVTRKVRAHGGRGTKVVFINRATSPPPPTEHHPKIHLWAPKSDARQADLQFLTDIPVSVTVNWGDGITQPYPYTTNATIVHEYPKQNPGPAGTGITYKVKIVANYSDGTQYPFPARDFFVPAPPPNGSGGPPPPPSG